MNACPVLITSPCTRRCPHVGFWFAIGSTWRQFLTAQAQAAPTGAVQDRYRRHARRTSTAVRPSRHPHQLIQDRQQPHPMMIHPSQHTRSPGQGAASSFRAPQGGAGFFTRGSSPDWMSKRRIFYAASSIFFA